MKDDSFKDFVLDQLESLGAVTCRTMFGGHGLYSEETFFGIIYKDRLYFKTDERSRSKYRDLGMKPFKPSSGQILKNYYEVPADVVEDEEEILLWAKTAARCRSV